MISAHLIIEQMLLHGVTHVVGVPDNGSRSLFAALQERTDLRVIYVSREGEAFALASGLLVGGATPLVLIQNTGLLESGDAFRGTAFNMELPLVMIVGYRGFAANKAPEARIDTAATFLEPTLKAWQIPYTLMSADSDVSLIGQAFTQARSLGTPHAVVLATQTR